MPYNVFLFTLFLSLLAHATSYEVEQFSFEENCFKGNCLYNNFDHLLELTKSTDEILQYDLYMNASDSIKNLKDRNVTSEDIRLEIKPFFEFFFSLNHFNPGGFHSEFREITRACRKEEVSNTFKLNDKIIFHAKAICMKENFKFNLKALEKECDDVLTDTFNLLDLGSDYQGSFSQTYTEMLINNPKFDDYIISFQKEIESKLGADWREVLKSLDRKKVDTFPENLRNLDLGKLALNITGNLKEAAQLIQVLVADPGAIQIKRDFRQKLRRQDIQRFKKMSSFLDEGLISDIIILGKYNQKVFGMQFHRNWSSRNYKAIAGMTLGLELAKKGHSEKMTAWSSQFVGAAYKAKAHILPALKNAKDIKGDKPYFIKDTTAHYVGAIVGHKAYHLKNDFNIKALEKTGRENANNYWDQIELVSYFLP